MNKEELEQLKDFANLENTEWGEAAYALLTLYRYKDFLSKPTQQTLEKEVQYQLQYVKENASIYEAEENIIQKIRYLEWNV